MSEDTAMPEEELAGVLTVRILGLDGVREVFPRRSVRAAAAALAAPARPVVGEAEVLSDASGTVVRVRLAVRAGAATDAVIARVAEAVTTTPGLEQARVRVDVSLID